MTDSSSGVTQADVITLDQRIHQQNVCESAGNQAYQQGKVAVLVVAGGQGTRLGFDGPKGCFPIDGERTIFALLADQIATVSATTGHRVPWLIMTSPHTDAPTRGFFAARKNLGLNEQQVRFFCQATVQSTDLQGHGLLAGPGVPLENPDGHGGCFEALVKSGELARLVQGGIEWLVYLQVDNVLGRVHDPFWVGLAQTRSADAVTKVLQKRDPDERVGHLVRKGSHDTIVEYTELSADDVRTVGPDGELLYRWGNTAMHCWRVGFLADLATRDIHLPLHRSRKPLNAWIDGEHREVQGYKSERFIFDLLVHADVSLGLEVARSAEFAPVKNATGNDSPDTARKALAVAHSRA